MLERQPLLAGAHARCVVEPGLVALAVAVRLAAGAAEPARQHGDGRLAAQVGGVDEHVEPLVVRAQCLEHLPHGLEVGAVQHGVVEQAGARRHHHGEDHVADVLAGSTAHHPPDGLDHVYLGLLRLEEDHSVQRGDVDALAQTAGIGDDPAGAFGVAGSQPRDGVGTFERILVAVDVADVAGQQLGCGTVASARGAAVDSASNCFDHRVPVALDQLGIADAVGEGDDPLGRVIVVDGTGDAVLGCGGSRIGQAVPASGETHCVVNLELVLVVDGDVVVGIEHRVLGHGDDQHFVIGEMPALHCVAERHAVHLGAIHRRVVHRKHVEAARGFLHPAASRFGVHPRGRSHVEPLGGTHPAGIMNQRIWRDGPLSTRCQLAGSDLLDASGAMRFIADRQVECRDRAEQARIRLGIGDEA